MSCAFCVSSVEKYSCHLSAFRYTIWAFHVFRSCFPKQDKTARHQSTRFFSRLSSVVLSGVCTEPKVIHSWLSTSITPIPVISSPRLYSPAQPDQKQPIHGVLLPDFGMKDGSTTIALRPPLRCSLIMASLKENQSKLSFSKLLQ